MTLHFFSLPLKRWCFKKKYIKLLAVTCVCFWYVNIPNKTSLFSKKAHQCSSWLLPENGSTADFFLFPPLDSGFFLKDFGNRELTFDFHDLPVGWWHIGWWNTVVLVIGGGSKQFGTFFSQIFGFQIFPSWLMKVQLARNHQPSTCMHIRRISYWMMPRVYSIPLGVL